MPDDHTSTSESARPRVVQTATEIRAAVQQFQSRGLRVGLVPTMGALHEGHLSLVRAARAACDATITTIFVNPTQFGPREDLAKYPRTFQADLDLLARERVDLVFAPREPDMYPPGYSTFVEPPAVSRPLEGQFRPGHFRGVATIVLKLLNFVPGGVAFFGQKDYQQCLVIRRMVEDLNVPVEIRICPTVRESDGLAMSSRNRYLSPEERKQALAISRSLHRGRELIDAGQRLAAAVRAEMQNVLSQAGIERVDYATVADPESLAEVTTISAPVALLIAAFVGQTRLIDNELVG